MFISIGSFLWLFSVIYCEIYTSIDEVAKLVATHENVVSNLEEYVRNETRRIDALKRHLEIFSRENKRAIENPEKYVQQPLNAFALIKRLTKDFEEIKTLASERSEFSWNRQLVFPTDEDLRGAAAGIARIQDYYKITISDLASGKLQDVSSPMSVSDCYHMGLALYQVNFFDRAAEWFILTLHRLKGTTKAHFRFTEADVMRLIVQSYHYSNTTIDEKALKWARILYHPAELYNQDEKDFVLKFYRDSTRVNRQKSVPEADSIGQLCRHEKSINAAETSKLHCAYLRHNPFLQLAPIKMEELYHDPKILLLHEVISDEEIEFFIEKGRPRLMRAGVYVQGLNTSRVTDTRVCKRDWLYPHDGEPVLKLKQRTADFTGLNVDHNHAEMLQILNYGIGGLHNLHYDAFEDAAVFEGRGNRICTVLFYLSDVPEGGATVFPKINLAVQPRKGTALVWINLFDWGFVDKRTIHAACPLVRGDKWVATIWIREAGQELLRPCPDPDYPSEEDVQ